MEPFTTLTAIAAPYYFPDVDTDKIIPHRFLRKPLSAGYRNFLFHDERLTPDGKEKPDFILHREPFRRAGILIAGRNFGCGSAREGAVYALQDWGFKALIAPSYADFFKANCLQNGVLPVELPEDAVAGLSRHVEDNPGVTLCIDLREQVIAVPPGARHRFEIEPSRKEQLLLGLDDIGVTFRRAASIEQFEKQYYARVPWLRPAR